MLLPVMATLKTKKKTLNPRSGAYCQVKVPDMA